MRSAVLESGVEHEILALGLIGEHGDRRRRRLPGCGGAVDRVSAGTPDPCNGFAPGNFLLLGSGIGEGDLDSIGYDNLLPGGLRDLRSFIRAYLMWPVGLGSGIVEDT